MSICRSILSAQRMNGPALDGKAHVVERAHAWEHLDDVPQLQNILRVCRENLVKSACPFARLRLRAAGMSRRMAQDAFLRFGGNTRLPSTANRISEPCTI